MSSMKEKMKAVASAISAIEKQFGKGAIMPLSGGDVAEIAVVPTGSVPVQVTPSLDRKAKRRPCACPVTTAPLGPPPTSPTVSGAPSPVWSTADWCQAVPFGEV